MKPMTKEEFVANFLETENTIVPEFPSADARLILALIAEVYDLREQLKLLQLKED
jgi:hypothetical protein